MEKKIRAQPKGEKKNSYPPKIAQPPPPQNKMVHPLQVNIYHEVSVTSTFTESDRR